MPGALLALGAQRERNPTILGTRDAQIDIGEGPLLARTLVVNAEIAALKPDLVEIRKAAQIIIMRKEFDANKVELMAKMVEGQPVP